MAFEYDVQTPMTPYADTGKVMFALWGDQVADALQAQVLRDDLAQAGVSRLQVNVDDAPVAEAMRIPSGPPINALVSVWGPSDPAVVEAVVAVLGRIADRVAGWRVDERRPLAPPETWDGTRVDALANMAVLRRPDDLDENTWKQRWLTDHTAVAIETQATFGYIQNLVLDAVTEEAPVVHAIVEELFPSAGISDMHAFYGSGGDDVELSARLTRLMASVSRIGADRGIDLVPSSRYLYSLTAESA